MKVSNKELRARALAVEIPSLLPRSCFLLLLLLLLFQLVVICKSGRFEQRFQFLVVVQFHHQYDFQRGHTFCFLAGCISNVIRPRRSEVMAESMVARVFCFVASLPTAM